MAGRIYIEDLYALKEKPKEIDLVVEEEIRVDESEKGYIVY